MLWWLAHQCVPDLSSQALYTCDLVCVSPAWSDRRWLFESGKTNTTWRLQRWLPRPVRLTPQRPQYTHALNDEVTTGDYFYCCVHFPKSFLFFPLDSIWEKLSGVWDGPENSTNWCWRGTLHTHGHTTAASFCTYCMKQLSRQYGYTVISFYY